MEEYETQMQKAQDLLAEVERGDLQEYEMLSKTREAISAILAAGCEHLDITAKKWDKAKAVVATRLENSSGNSGEWAEIEKDLYEAAKSTMTRELSARENAKIFTKDIEALLSEGDLKAYHSQYKERCENALGRLVSCIMYMKEAEGYFTEAKKQLKELSEKNPVLASWCEQLSSEEQTTLQDTLSAIEALKA